MEQGQRVIVRAYGDRPLERILCGENTRLAYIGRPDLYEAFLEGKSGAVGFPWDDVFEFDQDIYMKLSAEFDNGRNMTLAWQQAIPASRG